MSISAMKQAVDAMEKHGTFYLRHEHDYKKAIRALRQAITEAEKREWVGLTDEEIFDVADNFGYFQHGDAQGHKRLKYAKAIEAKLKERNNK